MLSPPRLLRIVSTYFLALRWFCFNIRQHGRQILYLKFHVDGCKFHYQRPPHAAVLSQVVHRCFEARSRFSAVCNSAKGNHWRSADFLCLGAFFMKCIVKDMFASTDWELHISCHGIVRHILLMMNKLYYFLHLLIVSIQNQERMQILCTGNCKPQKCNL